MTVAPVKFWIIHKVDLQYGMVSRIQVLTIVQLLGLMKNMFALISSSSLWKSPRISWIRRTMSSLFRGFSSFSSCWRLWFEPDGFMPEPDLDLLLVAFSSGTELLRVRVCLSNEGSSLRGRAWPEFGGLFSFSAHLLVPRWWTKVHSLLVQRLFLTEYL